MQLTDHFTQNELACKCGCGRCDMRGSFLAKLEKFRIAWGKPMSIVSGFRCEAKNLSLKNAAKNSPHIRGRAVDVRVRGSFERYMFLKLAFAQGFGGIAVNRTTVHLDDRPLSDPRSWHYY